MEPKSILDTDILSEYLKGNDAIVARRGACYAAEHGIFTFTSVTVFEIVTGLALKGAASQLSKALAWLDQNEEVTPTGADYRRAGIIKATAARQGSIVELPDCLIATTAARLERAVVTGNTEHFRALQRAGLNLALENWREAKQLS